LHAGIATHLCPSEKMAELESALLSEKDVSGVLDSFHSKELAKQPFSLQSKLQQINQVFAPETVEEILQKLAADGSDWAKKTSDTLHKMSPTSLKITMKQLRLGKQQNLQQCLQMEFRLTQRCCSGHDFIEGINYGKINHSRLIFFCRCSKCARRPRQQSQMEAGLAVRGVRRHGRLVFCPSAKRTGT
jgi:3-hydroxyisobutyryl-CoA hydrolase